MDIFMTILPDPKIITSKDSPLPEKFTSNNVQTLQRQVIPYMKTKV